MMRVQHLVRQSWEASRGREWRSHRGCISGKAAEFWSGGRGELHRRWTATNRYCSPFSHRTFMLLLCLATIDTHTLLSWVGSSGGVRRPIWLFDRALSLTQQSAIRYTDTAPIQDSTAQSSAVHAPRRAIDSIRHQRWVSRRRGGGINA